MEILLIKEIIVNHLIDFLILSIALVNKIKTLRKSHLPQEY